MALEKAMGTMVLEKIMVEYQEDKQFLEKAKKKNIYIYLLDIFVNIFLATAKFSFAVFGKYQRAKFSFAGFGKDHQLRVPMSKKSAYAATKNIDRLLIGSS